MIRNALRWSAIATLVFFHLACWMAPFVAPYDHRRQFRDFPHARPASVFLQFGTDGLLPRPAFQPHRTRGGVAPEPGGRVAPEIRFLVRSRPYTWMGMEWRTGLFGSSDPSQPLLLLGSDGLGRDLLSRILYGGRFSLTIGLAAIFSTLLLGVAAGGIAGYFRGWSDPILMRLADLFLSLPGLFMILGLRAILPGRPGTTDLFWLMILTFTLLGWASVARVVRGQVIVLKQKEHVLYARACGASPLRILAHHILPFTSSFLLVQSSLLVPAFIVGEITFSFLGVGVQEPDVSWGNLLVDSASISAFSEFPWLLAPALALTLVVLSFNFLADELKQIDNDLRGRPSVGF